MCSYTRKLKEKFSDELIQAFHIITAGEICCPVCQTTHKWEEGNYEEEIHVKEILDGSCHGGSNCPQ